MTLETLVRIQVQAKPQPQPVHHVVWSGVLERKGETFTLSGACGQGTLHNVEGRVSYNAVDAQGWR